MKGETMNQLTEKSISCPYCGETIEVLIDVADIDEQYIEDCQVCCKPISESPRVCQRLNNLRNWNYEKIKSLYIRIS